MAPLVGDLPNAPSGGVWPASEVGVDTRGDATGEMTSRLRVRSKLANRAFITMGASCGDSGTVATPRLREVLGQVGGGRGGVGRAFCRGVSR